MNLKFGILVLFVFEIGYCIKVIPQRIVLLYADPNEIEKQAFYVKRYGRKSPYYINIESKVLNPWYNNVTIHLIFYEYLHNEYRRSFVEMHYRICDFIGTERWTGAMFKNCGVTCPLFGEYKLMNMTIPLETFHYKMPMEKARIDIYFNMTDSNRMLHKSQIYILFKN